MNPSNQLLERIEAGRLWAYFHKDWLLQIRGLIRPQLPAEFSVFVESEAVLIAPSDNDRLTPVAPDLAVARSEPVRTTMSSFGQPTMAVVEVDEPCELFHQCRLVIRRVPDNRDSNAPRELPPDVSA